MSKLEDSLFEEFALFGLPLPVRQHKFHPTRKWLLDFAWPDRKIAVEIQGGGFIGGAHTGAGQLRDFDKLNEATRLGWKVYQFGRAHTHRPKRSRQQTSKAFEFLFPLVGGNAESNE
jgi:hypothetical protein